MLAVATLPLRRRTLPSGRARIVGTSRTRRALPFSPRCARTSDGQLASGAKRRHGRFDMNSAAPLLEARDLARHYIVSRGLFKRKDLVRALDGVSFSLREGRTLAVVGESGCGKSTLARQITMIERPTSGSLLLDGNDVAHADSAERKTLRPRVQMVFQNPYASLNPRKTVAALLEEPLAI